jgi:hypothetical protein
MNTEKIEKLKKGLTNSQIPESLREKIRQQISRLEAEDNASKPAPKEEAPTAKETVAPKVAKAPTVRKPIEKKVVAPKKETVGKTTAMSLAKEIRKDGEKWTDAVKRAGTQMKKGTTEVKKSTKTEMQKLLALVKRRKELKGISGTNLKRDAHRTALPKGKRVSENGKVYYENRDNRTDRLAPNYPKDAPLLELGGGVDETKYFPHYAPQAGGFGKIYSSELDNGSQYTYGQRSDKTYGKSDDNRGYLYKENGIYFVNGFENGKHFSESFDKFVDAKKFYLSKKNKSYELGGGVWSKEQKLAVEKLDAEFEKAVEKEGINPYSKEASNFWRSGGFQKKMGKIFNREYELGGNIQTDLAGHTGGTLGTGDSSLLDGFSNTTYTGQVGETGAMSSGEMFANGGGVSQDLFEDYKKQPKKLAKIVDFYMEKFEEGDYDYEDSQKFLKEVESVGYTFDYGLDNEPYGLRPIGTKLEEYELGGGLPSGVEQHYVNYYLGEGASQGIYANGGEMRDYREMEDSYAKGGGISTKNGRDYSTGRNWTNDHRHHNKGEDYEVPISKRKRFDNGGKIDNEFNYKMLSRLSSDNDYYLGNGNRSEKHLWAGNVDAQIKEMKRLWNNLPKDAKPDWLTMQDILSYEKKMKNKFSKGGDLGIEEEIDLTDDKRIRVKELTYEYKKPTAKELSEKHNAGAYEFMEQDKMMSGGKTTFQDKSNAIAKRFVGKNVEPKYQKEYGKVYSKDEAKEVGDKITGSMVAKEKIMTGGKTKKGNGGAMLLAKKIRKDGESWNDAVKRAWAQLK